MWFRNLQLLRLAPGIAIDPDLLNRKLAERPLIACGGLERKRIGWVPAYGETFAHHQGGHILVAMGIDEKLLPATVVKQEVEKKIASIAEQDGYRPGSKRRREIREQVEDELLPRAFTRRVTVRAWLDPINGWLAVDTASAGKAEALVKLLGETATDLPIRLPHTRFAPGHAMTAMLMEDAPPSFTIDRDGELRLPGEDRATVRYVHHALDGSEIAEHIAQGKQATRLGLTWDSRISFVLTEKLEIKRLQFLDIIKEQSNQAEDAEAMFQIEFALMSGELAKLIADLVAALGGIEEYLVDQANGGQADNQTEDPLYDQAVTAVLESQRASISYVQRNLRIGYNRAARLIETMERAGLVSPMKSDGSRDVLALTAG